MSRVTLTPELAAESAALESAQPAVVELAVRNRKSTAWVHPGSLTIVSVHQAVGPVRTTSNGSQVQDYAVKCIASYGGALDVKVGQWVGGTPLAPGQNVDAKVGPEWVNFSVEEAPAAVTVAGLARMKFDLEVAQTRSLLVQASANRRKAEADASFAESAAARAAAVDSDK